MSVHCGKATLSEEENDQVLIFYAIVFNTMHLHCVCDMRVQLGQLARQDLMDHQGRPDHQEILVFQALEWQVLQAIRVNLDHQDFLEIQVIDYKRT